MANGILKVFLSKTEVKMNIKGSNHLTLAERQKIREMLEENEKCKTIATFLLKDERTISREVKKRRNKQENGRYGLYGKKDDSSCKRLQRFPFVCNGCNKRKSCFKQFKFFYEPSIAQENYEIILRDSRIGLDITLEDKAVFDAVLKEGISKGQSIHHIVEANKDIIRYSERSVYRLIDRAQTIVQPLDLRRKVKLKPRKHYVYKEDNKRIRMGRTYADYIAFLASNPLIHPAQMDTVESTSKGVHQCLLTIHFPSLRFMLIFVLKQKCKDEVTRVFMELKKLLGIELYKKLFPAILTDRGTEFCAPEMIEVDTTTGEVLTHVFFCDSYSSFQKGAIEENHELIRYILPKSVIFDALTQEQAELMASHINSFNRKVIGTSPYNLAKAFWGEDVLAKFNCKPIVPNDVLLNPQLLH